MGHQHVVAIRPPITSVLFPALADLTVREQLYSLEGSLLSQPTRPTILHLLRYVPVCQQPSRHPPHMHSHLELHLMQSMSVCVIRGTCLGFCCQSATLLMCWGLYRQSVTLLTVCCQSVTLLTVCCQSATVRAPGSAVD
jgi:hypothetical protein